MLLFLHVLFCFGRCFPLLDVCLFCLLCIVVWFDFICFAMFDFVSVLFCFALFRFGVVCVYVYFVCLSLLSFCFVRFCSVMFRFCSVSLV